MSRPEPNKFVTPDHTGYIPEQRLISTFWRNQKTEHIYQIVDYIFDADEDRWKIVYTRYEGNGQEYTRLPENFFGVNTRGKTRFEQAIPTFYTRSDCEELPSVEDRHDDA